MTDDIFTDDTLDAIVDWCEKAYPEEGCGLVVQTDESDWRVIETENLADKYHQLDPETYPRTAEKFYVIDPMEFMRVEDRGEELAVIFHSHVDVGDYFSEEDVSAATMPRDEDSEPLEPSYPGVDYLVVSVREDGADHATLFRYDEQAAKEGADHPFPAVLEIAIDGDGDYQVTDPRN